ncbi:LAFA_0F22628g1_1 [Lachancea sp. 'fantastica']|nr:LAFA_0F22628g1_1 [Lachancea sp. 'fantastica']
MEGTENNEQSNALPADRTIASSSRMIQVEGAGTSPVENSSISKQSSNIATHNSREQSQLYEQNYHSRIIPGELSSLRCPKSANSQIVKAMEEEIKRNHYKTSDDGKEFRFRWDNTSTYYLAKNCCEIGPFLGFENIKPEPSFKLETSSLISLKWSCVLYNLLMSIKFKGNIVPTELQLKTRVKYLVDSANNKIIAGTTGDEKNPCTITGDDKTDELIEDLAKLKNAADTRRTEIQKLDAQRQSYKRDIGKALCNNSLPQVMQDRQATDLERSFSATDDVNAPNMRTISKRRRVNGAASALLSDVENSNSSIHSELQQDHITLLGHFETVLNSMNQAKQVEMALEKEKIALEREKIALEMELEKEKIALEREKIALEKEKVKNLRVTSLMTTYLQYHEKLENTSPELAKLIGDQWRVISFNETTS